MKRIAFYGGSFDPLHNGHLTIARKLIRLFKLDEFVFVPAFHAPHKKDKNPTSAFHRYAMLCLATDDAPKIKVSKIELEAPERPYTFETLPKLKKDLPGTQIFFVMGSDSWQEITTWREWETVLTTVNIIVVTRPAYEIGFSHVTNEIQDRIVDWRGKLQSRQPELLNLETEAKRIYITDAVQLDISATKIRQTIKHHKVGWQKSVPNEVAQHIEKYELYI